MSMDTIDDLHFAEDEVGRLATEVARLKLGLADGDLVPDAAVAAELSGYCRPTCRHRDEGECASGDDCACLCGHGDNDG